MNEGLWRYGGPQQQGNIDWATRIHGSGTLSARPPACPANRGYYYTATDANGGTTYRSTGSSWQQVAAPLNVPLSEGGTGADLSATGPGFLRQVTTGAPATVSPLTAADMPVSPYIALWLF